MLWEEVKKYTKLTGEDGWHTPIIKVGAYLDGYDKGTAVIDKIRAEIEEIAKPNEIGGRGNGKSIRYGLCLALEIIDKHRAESEVDDEKNS